MSPILAELSALVEKPRPAGSSATRCAASRCTTSTVFPVTSYREEWVSILPMADEIREFISENESKMKKTRGTE